MNSFLNIKLQNLEIINYGPAVPQPPIPNSVDRFNEYKSIFDHTTTILKFSDLIDYKFKKDYVLLWHKNYVNYCGDPEPIRKEEYNNIAI